MYFWKLITSQPGTKHNSEYAVPLRSTQIAYGDFAYSRNVRRNSPEIIGGKMIEFQYFDGCPNSEATLKNLKELIKEGLIQEDSLKITEVPDLESAESFNFQGSPTVLVNGRDIYTEIEPESFNYSCRVYSMNGIHTGVLTKDYLKNKILKLQG